MLVFRIFECFWIFAFSSGKNPLKLWVPPHTTFIKDSEWLMSTLEVGYRRQDIIIKSDNVLTPKILQEVRNVIKKFAINLSYLNM